MPSAIGKSIAWVLVATLALVAGIGDGLHLIPGCGHGVPVGDRTLLLGISVPWDHRTTDDRPHVERPEGQDIPIYDEDQCAICSVVGQSCTSGDSAPLVLVMPLACDLPAVVLCDAPVATAHPFQARAPPLG